MEELILLFNNEKTHIEVDCINQKDNGTTKEDNVYTYTVLLICNATGEEIESASVKSFDKKDIKFVTSYFEGKVME